MSLYHTHTHTTYTHMAYIYTSHNTHTTNHTHSHAHHTHRHTYAHMLHTTHTHHRQHTYTHIHTPLPALIPSLLSLCGTYSSPQCTSSLYPPHRPDPGALSTLPGTSGSAGAQSHTCVWRELHGVTAQEQGGPGPLQTPLLSPMMPPVGGETRRPRVSLATLTRRYLTRNRVRPGWFLRTTGGHEGSRIPYRIIPTSYGHRSVATILWPCS